MTRFTYLISITLLTLFSTSPAGSKTRSVSYFLPKSILTITVRQLTDHDNQRIWYDLGGSAEDARANPSAEIADPSERHVIRLDGRLRQTIDLCVTQSANGLLREVSFGTVSGKQHLKVLIDPRGGQQNQTRSVPFPVDSNPKRNSNESRVKRVVFTGRLDPFAPDDVEAFHNGLRVIFNANLRINLTRLRKSLRLRTTNSIPDHTESARSRKGSCSINHICYRVKRRLPIDLTYNGNRVATRYVAIVDPNVVNAIDIDRAWSEKIEALGFENGVLTHVIPVSPLTKIEASQLPLTIYDAMLTSALAAPGSFLSEITANTNDVKLPTDQTGNAQASRLTERLRRLRVGAISESTTAANQVNPDQRPCVKGFRKAQQQ